jgi:hypothetical protein
MKALPFRVHTLLSVALKLSSASPTNRATCTTESIKITSVAGTAQDGRIGKDGVILVSGTGFEAGIRADLVDASKQVVSELTVEVTQPTSLRATISSTITADILERVTSIVVRKAEASAAREVTILRGEPGPAAPDVAAGIELVLTTNQAISSGGAAPILLFTRNQPFAVRPEAFSYNATTGELTINEAGYYQINFHGIIGTNVDPFMPGVIGNAAGGRAYYVEVNGKQRLAAESLAAPAEYYSQSAGAKIMQLAVGDKVVMRVYQSSGVQLFAIGRNTDQLRSSLQLWRLR